MPVPDIDSVRIIEIGYTGHFKQAFPGQTRFFNTSEWKTPRGEPKPWDLDSLASLVQALLNDDYDLIVCSPDARNPWYWQSIGRFVFSRNVLSNMRRPLRPFGPQLLRLFRKAPVIVVDTSDPAFINRDNFFLMDRATLFFKRELPADEWRLLTKTASVTQPSNRLRRSRRFRERLAKLRPLPLGLPSGVEADLPPQMPEKKTDIFFAGTSKGFGVRERALEELEALRGEGYVVDVAKDFMPRPDFYGRCGEAWLTLSPEGHGWDCFRHYEAAASWSVPLINQPSIRRHAPLLHGEHALYFDVEPGALSASVRSALADRHRLAEISRAGRAHVLANHTRTKIARYVIETSLAALRQREALAAGSGSRTV